MYTRDKPFETVTSRSQGSTISVAPRLTLMFKENNFKNIMDSINYKAISAAGETKAAK